VQLLRLGIHENQVSNWIKRSHPVKFDQRVLSREVQHICSCSFQVLRLDQMDLVKVFQQWPDMAQENSKVLEQGLLVLTSPRCSECPRPFLIIGDEAFVNALLLV
jgi:hypothetical protein